MDISMVKTNFYYKMTGFGIISYFFTSNISITIQSRDSLPTYHPIRGRLISLLCYDWLKENRFRVNFDMGGDYHCTYIRYENRKICARKEQSLLFDLFKAFDLFEKSHKSSFFSENTCFPFCVRNMF